MSKQTRALAIVIALAATRPARGQTFTNVTEIDGDKVHVLLAPDDIPSIDEPAFASADAKFMRDDEPVIGVVHNGVAKAYSVWHLDEHEIVNDDFGGTPVAVTW